MPGDDIYFNIESQGSLIESKLKVVNTSSKTILVAITLLAGLPLQMFFGGSICFTLGGQSG